MRGYSVILMLEFQSSVDFLISLRIRQYVDNHHMEMWKGRRFSATSRPYGIAFSPTASAAYVTLQAVGRLLRLDAAAGAVTGSVDVGPTRRSRRSIPVRTGYPVDR